MFDNKMIIPQSMLSQFLVELAQPMFITVEGYQELLGKLDGFKASKLVTSEIEEESIQPKEFLLSYSDMNGNISDNKPESKYISVINIEGALFSKPNVWTKYFGYMSYPDISRLMKEAVMDENSEGILFNINSPGGQSIGLMDLSDEIYNMRNETLIFAIANDFAFSAAYGIASGAEKLFVTRDGMVGSVGVIMQHADFSKVLEDFGIKLTTIFAGKRKNDFSPYYPLSKEAKSIAEKMVNDSYEDFTRTVARNRGLKQTEVKSTEAGIFSSKDAIDIKFADEVGSYEDSIAGMFDGKGSSETNNTSEFKGSSGGDVERHEENETQSNEKIQEREEVKDMDLKELKEKHPDLYNQVIALGKEEAKREFSQERTELTSQVTDLKQENSDKEKRILQLEKSETIRSEKERQTRAEQIFDKALEASSIPEHMYGKVKKMVPFSQFVKDDILDESSFLEAVSAEIKDWEDKGVKSSVLGAGYTNRSDVDAKEKETETQNKADDQESSDLLSLAGQKQDKE